jgi:hypothetical protein
MILVSPDRQLPLRLPNRAAHPEPHDSPQLSPHPVSAHPAGAQQEASGQHPSEHDVSAQPFDMQGMQPNRFIAADDVCIASRNTPNHTNFSSPFLHSDTMLRNSSFLN